MLEAYLPQIIFQLLPLRNTFQSKLRIPSSLNISSYLATLWCRGLGRCQKLQARQPPGKPFHLQLIRFSDKIGTGDLCLVGSQTVFSFFQQQSVMESLTALLAGMLTIDESANIQLMNECLFERHVKICESNLWALVDLKVAK